jgi:hypothetical protein
MKHLPIIIFMLSHSLAMSGQTNTNTITQFSNIVLTNHNIGFNYLSQSTLNGGLTSSMTYQTADIADKNAAFTFNCNIPATALPDGFKGYPSSTIGGFKTGGSNGTYSPGVRSACGMPVQIKDLNNDLRIKWRVSQQNATDPNDKWWASINVIFDNGAETLEPVSDDRDYDLVIELNRYANETRIDDEPISNNDYWKFARTDKNNSSSPLKTLDLHYGGQVYKWAVRYKFFNYPATDPRSTKNNKVHIKFIAMFAGNAVAPYLDHPLKTFVDATKDYLQYVSLSPAEQTKVNAQVALPNTWVKSISAGYEVYTGTFTIKNEVFKTTIDNTAPATPTGLSSVNNTNNIFLNWNDVTTDSIEHYKIYRATNGGAFQLLDSSYISQYTDNAVNNYSNYAYLIKAIDRSFNPSNSSAITSVSAVLPLELRFFKGENTAEGNLLTWATASEVKHNHFELEHSLDSKTWALIGNITGKGDSQSEQYYSFLDKNRAAQINYYRLKSIDTEGRYEHSKVVVLDNSEKGKIKIYPNPATAVLNIEVTENQLENIEIQLFNSIEQQVYFTKIEANSGYNLTTITTSSFPEGLYNLTIIKGGNRDSRKVVIR